MTVGERIKQKRIELNMTQDELAKKVGYKSRSSIQKIETARDLPLRKVLKMAKALDCTPGELMGWEDYIPPEETPTYIIPRSELETKNSIIVTDIEKDLIKNYRKAPEEDKRTVERLLMYASSIKRKGIK